MEPVIVSSNKNKLKEFKEFIPYLNSKEGVDLPEVDSDYITVAKYKALSVSPGSIIDDSILFVNGVEVVDIKWKKHTLKEGDEATWITTLGYNNGTHILLYKGVTDGYITRLHEDPDAFSFSDVFVPLGETKTLHQLNNKTYNARYRAIQDFEMHKHTIRYEISNIKPWTGDFQKEQ